MVFCRFRPIQRNYADNFFKPFEKKLMAIDIKISFFEKRQKMTHIMLYSSPTHQNSSDKSNIGRASEASTVRPASNVAHKLLVCKNKHELTFFYAEYLRLHGYESCADTFYCDVCV